MLAQIIQKQQKSHYRTDLRVLDATENLFKDI